MRSMSSGFHVAPMAMPQGTERAAPGEALATDSGGPVGDLERRDAEALDGRDEPQAGAGGEGRLLIECQALQQCVDVGRVDRVGLRRA